MAVFLIDYENVVATKGLAGVEYLKQNDKIFLFYSGCCSKIRNDEIESIRNSGCGFKICKLVKPGKNALDFYIAATCGILYQQGENQLAIISNDKGFSAVVDFFRTKKSDDFSLVTACNIERGILALNSPEDKGRRNLIANDVRMLDLEVEHAKLQERNAIREDIRSAFAGTKFEASVPNILSFLENGNQVTRRKLYTESLHRFGLKEGLEFYQLLKEVI